MANPLVGRDPRKAFYVAALAAHLDDSVSLDGEMHTSFDTEECALQWLKEEMIEHGDDTGWVFKVVCIARAKRGKMRVRRTP